MCWRMARHSCTDVEDGCEVIHRRAPTSVQLCVAHLHAAPPCTACHLRRLVGACLHAAHEACKRRGFPLSTVCDRTVPFFLSFQHMRACLMIVIVVGWHGMSVMEHLALATMWTNTSYHPINACHTRSNKSFAERLVAFAAVEGIFFSGG